LVSSKSVRLGNDIYTARKKVRNLPKEEQKDLLDSAEKRAIKFLSDPQIWQVLERIATKLLEVETLDGPSLYVLLEDIQKTEF
jgi:ATP-dependent Zn protease